MTLPALPPEDDANWYPHYTGLHNAATEVVTGRLTDAKLKGAFAAQADVHTDFRTRPNGIPTAGDEGLPFVLNPPSGTQVMTVSGGKLVAGVDGITMKASYLQQNLGANVHRLGGEFMFGAGTDGGSVTFVPWSNIIPDPYVVPDTPCHFVVTPTMWTYGIWQGQSPTQLASGTFATPLTQDMATVYRAEVQLKGNTAYILLPDGKTAQVTDSRIASIAAPVACFEIYKNASTDAAAAWVRFWADTDADALGAATPSEVARVINRAPFLAAPSTVKLAPASSANVAIPASMTTINSALTVTVTVPASGKLWVELCAWLTISTSSTIYWSVANGASSLLWRTVSTGTRDSLCVLKHLVTGLTPGTVLTPVWQHMATVTNAGNLMTLNSPAGYEAAMSITPVN